MAGAEQFLRDLAFAYRELNTSCLEADFLTEVLTGFGKMYAEKPAKTAEAYALALAVSVEALTAFTQRIHPYCLEASPTPALFHRDVSRSAAVLPDWNGQFLPDAIDAYRALCGPFGQHRLRLSQLDVFNWQHTTEQYYYPFRELEPLDTDERRSWRQRKRDHEELRKDILKSTPDWQTVFFHTPLITYSSYFIPHGVVQLPFDIPPLYWFRATWCVAAPDRGKTNLLRHLILHHHPGASVIVLDAKGDLLKSFQRLASIKDRLVVIEPDEDNSPALNPLDMGPNSAEFLAYLFSLLEADMTPNQETLFYMVGLLLNRIPNATLRTLRDIIANGWRPYPDAVEAIKRLHPDEQTFFYEEFDSYADRRPEILMRLRRLMTNPCLRAMLTAPTNRLGLSDLMDEGKVVLINNSYNPDKLGEQGAEFFGRLIVAMVWAAARRRASRPDDKKRPVFFVMDEAHFVIARDRTIKKIINQCRSQKIAMIFAHQEVIDIKDDEAKSALSNCGIKFANSLGEAYELAPRLHCDPAFINQRQGTFACEVVDQPPTVALEVPHIRTNPDQTLADLPVIPDDEFQALMLKMRAEYCWTPDSPPRPSRSPTQGPSSSPDREGELRWTITINPRKAREGGKQRIRLTHIGVTIEVTIPPGTHSGQTLCLRGRGAFKADGKRGDLFIKLRTKTDTPSHTDQHAGNLRIGHDDAQDAVAEPESEPADSEAW